MRHTPHPQEPARKARHLAVTVLSAVLLATPSVAFAQASGPHGPGMSGMQAQGMQPRGMQAQGMQGTGPHGPGMQTNTERMSRSTERFLRIYDLNGDGKVSIDEINADQARMFTALDIDNDKKMSVDEIRRRGRSLQIFRTTTLFDLLDANGDGYLSLAELQAPSKRWFKRYDTNGDGFMDANEIPEQRHWGRGGQRR